MAPRPSGQAEHPPPDVPSMPDVSVSLINYLRTFALWARQGFADRLPARQALPGVLLQAYDAPSGTTPAVYMIRVDSTGAISTTQVPLGSGAP